MNFIQVLLASKFVFIIIFHFNISLITQCKQIILFLHHKFKFLLKWRMKTLGLIAIFLSKSSIYFHHQFFSPSKQPGILAAMREWNTRTGGCISFRKRTNERNYLEFFVGNGCWGHLGKPNGKSQISVGRGCEGQNVMSHEIGHALGFWYVFW